MSKNKTVSRLQSPPNEVLLQQICCITDDIVLTAAADEINYLKGIGARYVHPRNKYELIRELGEKGGDVLHFACRDRAEMRRANGWAIQLPDGGAFKPADLNQRGVSNQIRQKHPLVFFNVYQSKREANPEASLLVGMDEWTKRFIDLGCGAMIGCVWEIDSPLASDFAVLFYKSLISGLTLGQAVPFARREIMKEKNTPWLAYSLYGNPSFCLRSI